MVRVLCMALLACLWMLPGAASAADANAPGNPALQCEVALSEKHILPFEPVGVLVRLRNVSDREQRIQLATSWVSIGEVSPSATAGMRAVSPAYGERAVPLPPKWETLAPGAARTWTHWLDIRGPGREHTFAKPGRYPVEGHVPTWGEDHRLSHTYRSPGVALDVQRPQVLDALAYERLLASRRQADTDLVPLLSESSLEWSFCTQASVQQLEKLAWDYRGSRYSTLARLALGMVRIKGLDGTADLGKAVSVLTELARCANEPVASRARYYLGIAMLKAGDREAAKGCLREVLVAHPDPFYRFLAEQALAGYPRTNLLQNERDLSR